MSISYYWRKTTLQIKPRMAYVTVTLGFPTKVGPIQARTVYNYFCQLLESTLDPYTYDRLLVEYCPSPSVPRMLHLRLSPRYRGVLQIHGRFGQGNKQSYEECLRHTLEEFGLSRPHSGQPSSEKRWGSTSSIGDWKVEGFG